MTDAEMLVLGLVSEMPRHGYELEHVIDERGMREWTQIGFSSIYFVLGKLEKAGFVTAEKPSGRKARKIFSITPAGRNALIGQAIGALSEYRPTYSSVLLGMVHWPALSRDVALKALNARVNSIQAEKNRLEQIRSERQLMPDFIEALFDFSANQLEAEEQWIAKTAEYMKTKP